MPYLHACPSITQHKLLMWLCRKLGNVTDVGKGSGKKAAKGKNCFNPSLLLRENISWPWFDIVNPALQLLVSDQK